VSFKINYGFCALFATESLLQRPFYGIGKEGRDRCQDAFAQRKLTT
jgi:hypothetical protein